GAHRDVVDVHQTTGGILRIGQHVCQLLALLHVHRQQQLAAGAEGQRLDQVDQVIQVQFTGGRKQLGIGQLQRQAGGHLFAQVNEDLPDTTTVQPLPDTAALSLGQGFQQRRRLGGVQPAEDYQRLLELARFQRLTYHGDRAYLGLGIVIQFAVEQILLAVGLQALGQGRFQQREDGGLFKVADLIPYRLLLLFVQLLEQLGGLARRQLAQNPPHALELAPGKRIGDGFLGFDSDRCFFGHGAFPSSGGSVDARQGAWVTWAQRQACLKYHIGAASGGGPPPASILRPILHGRATTE